MSKVLGFFLLVSLVCSCSKEEDIDLVETLKGRFLYTWQYQTGYELFVLEKGVEQKITDDAEGVVTPEWFPDGEKIVFLTYDIEGGSLHVINPDGTGDRSIYEIGDSEYNSFYLPRIDLSPDGRKILMTMPDSIILLSITTTFEVEKIKSLPCKTTLSYTGWAPDSEKFSCRCQGDNSFGHLWVYDLDDDTFHNLTPQFTYYIGPQSWSFQSDKIAFTVQSDLFIANSDGSELYNLTDSLPFGVTSVSFSPTENQLAYIRSDGLSDLVIYDLETNESDVLIENGAYISDPLVWIEEGKYLGYSSGEELFELDGYYMFDLVARKSIPVIKEEINYVDWIE